MLTLVFRIRFDKLISATFCHVKVKKNRIKRDSPRLLYFPGRHHMFQNGFKICFDFLMSATFCQKKTFFNRLKNLYINIFTQLSGMKCRMIIIQLFSNFLNISFLDQNLIMKWLRKTVWFNDGLTVRVFAEYNIVSFTRSFKNCYIHAKAFSAMKVFMIQS